MKKAIQHPKVARMLSKLPEWLPKAVTYFHFDPDNFLEYEEAKKRGDLFSAWWTTTTASNTPVIKHVSCSSACVGSPTSTSCSDGSRVSSSSNGACDGNKSSHKHGLRFWWWRTRNDWTLFCKRIYGCRYKFH